MNKNHQTTEGNQYHERTSHATIKRIPEKIELRDLADGNKREIPLLFKELNCSHN